MTASQKRASLILQVRSGQLTAQEAAQQLSISRQAFYKWEKRALKALLNALEDQPPGRPKGTTGIHQVPRNLHVLSATWPRPGGLLTEDDRGDPIAITNLVLEQLVRGIVARSAA